MYICVVLLDLGAWLGAEESNKHIYKSVSTSRVATLSQQGCQIYVFAYISDSN